MGPPIWKTPRASLADRQRARITVITATGSADQTFPVHTWAAPPTAHRLIDFNELGANSARHLNLSQRRLLDTGGPEP